MQELPVERILEILLLHIVHVPVAISAANKTWVPHVQEGILDSVC
jgi:hypothetical protein